LEKRRKRRKRRNFLGYYVTKMSLVRILVGDNIIGIRIGK
jgi:hypothetical protein